MDKYVLPIFLASCGLCLLACGGAGNIKPEPVPPDAHQPDPAEVAPPLPPHTIESIDDVSFAGVVRKVYDVRVRGEMTESELTAIARDIVKKATDQQRIDAIGVYFYLPESEIRGVCTAGRATWAPGGEWGKAGSDLPPKLVVEVRNPRGTLNKDSIVDLPLNKKQEIFVHIASLQDGGMIADQTFAAAAKQFGITEADARKIGLEGAVMGWPMASVPALDKSSKPEERAAPSQPIDPEKAAAGRLRLAKQYLDKGETAIGTRWLQKVLKDYPFSEAAKEATELLSKVDK